MKHKKQHVIPRIYLSAWLDPIIPEGYEPYVWLIDIATLEIRNKAPKNIFHETDYYTFTNVDGDRDLSLEQGLSQLEGMYASIVRDKISIKLPLNPDDHMKLCAFISAMHARTPRRIEHTLPFYEEALSKLKQVADWEKTATQEQIENMRVMASALENEPYMTMQDLEEVLEEPVPSLVPPEISALTPLLMKLDMAVYETSFEPGFITSDNPCFWHDPEGHKREYPYQGPALMYPSIEITMPVTPRQVILLNRQGINGYVDLSGVGIEVDLDAVRKINFRTRLSAKESLIVNKKIILWDWFLKRPNEM
jgi:hypothetical protein